jgi:hypothetical protein
MKDDNPGFWEEGDSNYADALAKEQHARLAPLKEELKNAFDPTRKAELKQQIAAVEAEFRTKQKNADFSLF